MIVNVTAAADQTSTAEPAPAHTNQERRCVVCGGPSPGVECNSCFIAAEVVYERTCLDV